MENYIVLALITGNLLLGFGFAVPLSFLIKHLDTRTQNRRYYFFALVGMYGSECVALVGMMMFPAGIIGLAFLWGYIIGNRIQTSEPVYLRLKTTARLSLYSSLPSVSFIIVPFFVAFGGWDILSAEQALKFGIPDFLHPLWPLNTILGFFILYALCASVLKTTITTGLVSLIIHYRQFREVQEKNKEVEG